MKLEQLYEQLLIEASYTKMFKYDKDWEQLNSMFTGGDYHDGLSSVNAFIAKAKRTLKRDDRIVWTLRIYKLLAMYTLQQDIVVRMSASKNSTELHELPNGKKVTGKEYAKIAVNLFAKELTKYNRKTKGKKYTDNDFGNLFFGENSMSAALYTIEHFLSLGIHAIDTMEFKWQTHKELHRTFLALEKEWKETRKRMIQYDEDSKVFLKLDGKFEWVDLESASCSIEGDAMGHCGNGGRTDPNTTVLSLRERIMVKGTLWWKPHATFIYEKKEKSLGEMKGVYNKKPKKEMHKHIVELLKDKRIQGIHSGGYQPEENFSVNDLEDSVADKLIAKKPNLLPFGEYVQRFGIDKIVMKKLKEAKLEFVDGGKQAVIQTFVNADDFIEDHGNHTAQYIMKYENGEEFLEVTYDGFYDKDNITHQMSSTYETKFEEYTAKKYPEEYDDNDNDWYHVLQQNQDDAMTGIEGLEGAFQQATESGTMQEMNKAMETAWDDAEISREVDEFALYPDKFPWDDTKKVFVTLSLDGLKIVAERWTAEDIDNSAAEFVDYLSDLGSEYEYDFKFKVDEPYNGFNDFDEKYFNELLGQIDLS